MSNTCLECFGTGRSCALPGFPCSTCNRAEFFAARDVFNNVRVELPAPSPQSAQPCPYSTKPGASPARVQRSPASDEARVARARQPPEPAKPYGDDDLAFFRERARQRLFSLSGPPARLLATIDLREAERDQALASLKVSDEGRTAAIRMMDAWKDKADKSDEALTELREAVRALLNDQSITTCPRCNGSGEVRVSIDDDFRCTSCDETGERPTVHHLRTLLEVKP